MERDENDATRRRRKPAQRRLKKPRKKGGNVPLRHSLTIGISTAVVKLWAYKNWVMSTEIVVKKWLKLGYEHKQVVKLDF
jgi:hypothetical protein